MGIYVVIKKVSKTLMGVQMVWFKNDHFPRLVSFIY